MPRSYLVARQSNDSENQILSILAATARAAERTFTRSLFDSGDGTGCSAKAEIHDCARLGANRARARRFRGQGLAAGVGGHGADRRATAAHASGSSRGAWRALWRSARAPFRAGKLDLPASRRARQPLCALGA